MKFISIKKKHLLKALLAFGVSFGLIASYAYYQSNQKRNLEPVLLESAISYRHNKITNRRYLIIVDYRLPVFAKRLWVYDRINKKAIINCQVTHAIFSGIFYANNYSNEVRSYRSCYGRFVTDKSYAGDYGYSMRVDGLEASNNNAMDRAIVFHPLDIYISGIRIPVTFLPYSGGCFAINKNELNEIISRTRNGTLVYVRENK